MQQGAYRSSVKITAVGVPNSISVCPPFPIRACFGPVTTNASCLLDSELLDGCVMLGLPSHVVCFEPYTHVQTGF